METWFRPLTPVSRFCMLLRITILYVTHHYLGVVGHFVGKNLKFTEIFPISDSFTLGHHSSLPRYLRFILFYLKLVRLYQRPLVAICVVKGYLLQNIFVDVAFELTKESDSAYFQLALLNKKGPTTTVSFFLQYRLEYDKNFSQFSAL